MSKKNCEKISVVWLAEYLLSMSKENCEKIAVAWLAEYLLSMSKENWKDCSCLIGRIFALNF